MRIALKFADGAVLGHRLAPESLLNVSLINIHESRNVSRTATTGPNMHTIETTDPIEARRARFAQYSGREATLTLKGSTVTGMVRSVNELGAGPLKRWIVTVFAK
jgi:hypothetical protein